jgi:thermitase
MHQRLTRILGILGFLAIGFTVWVLGERQTKHLASVTSSVGRSMELGQVRASKEKNSEQNVILNDPAMNLNWGLSSADANKAWEVSHGSKSVIVAVIDTGIDIRHPDIRNNLWRNEKECNGDPNKDNDGNGFKGDCHGWNFVHNNADLTDNHGHGSHIAGIIGAEGGNGIGISGVSPRVSIMAIKYFDPRSTGSNNLDNTVKSINYAVDNGAHIINYSGGGLEYSQAEFDAIRRAEARGILFVAAAGNEKSNSDVSKYYPANYGLSNIISVTAIDPKTNTLPSSNWGIRTVDIAAPGLNIYSLLPGGQYGEMTGTSQATAFVSGVAALIKANFPDFTAADLKKHIIHTGDYSDTLASKTGTSRRLNIYKALTTLDQNVGVSGVVATNTQDMEPAKFNSDGTNLQDPGLKDTDPTDGMGSFGKSLLRKINAQ